MVITEKLINLLNTRKRPRIEVQLLFLKRLERMLKEGYSITTALEFLQWDQQLCDIVESVITNLKRGKTLDDALEQLNFHESIVSYLYFIRINGDINGTLSKCIEMFEQRMHYLKRFKQITQYPLLLTFIFSFLFVFMKQTILPSFLDLFSQNQEVVKSISVSIMIINIISNLVIVFLIGLFLFIIFWLFIRKKLLIERQIKIYLAIPIYRSYLRNQTSFQFATHLSTYLHANLSMKEVLIKLSLQNKQPILAHYAKLMHVDLENGFPLQVLLSELKLIDHKIPILFQRNSDHLTLAKDLSVYATILLEELQQKIMRSLTIIQPLFFLCLAGFIIFIYISMFWPMFQLIKTI